MSKNIGFEPTSEESELLFDMPTPASLHMPAWYKNMPLHLDGEEITGLAPDSVGSSNLTLRGCMPFLDAISSGYMFTLPFDIEIRKDHRGLVGIRWATNVDLIGQHSQDQAPGLPIPVGGSPHILKWKPGWRVVTPKGYSCLFTHPLNHIDLPFVTLSGVVDTDTYKLGTEIPFRLLDTGEEVAILERGTPICQVIPFKRDDWASSQVKFDAELQKREAFELKSRIIRSYQRFFWQRKSFK